LGQAKKDPRPTVIDDYASRYIFKARYTLYIHTARVYGAVNTGTGSVKGLSCVVTAAWQSEQRLTSRRTMDM